MKAITLIENQWEFLLTYLPGEATLAKMAEEAGALVRQRRLAKASDLLRCILVYSFCGYSLRQTAAWAELQGIGSFSNVALLKRLRHSPEWMGRLLALKLAERATPPPGSASGLKLRLVDASTISKPGSKGTDWRVHLMFDVGRMAIQDVQVTDTSEGESLSRYSISPGDVVVADRGYIHRKGFWHILQQKGQLIVRLNWQNLPMMTPDGKPFELLPSVRSLPEAAIGEYAVVVQESRSGKEQLSPPIPARVVVLRKTEVAAAEARQRIIREFSRKGKVPTLNTLEAASYVFVLTTLDAGRLAAHDVLNVYRFRWQVELCFKRLKSLLELDELQAKDPDLARTFLYGKLLTALLLDEMTEAFLGFSPWGFPVGRHTPVVVANPAAPP